MSLKLLVTGGAGFIGSNFIRLALKGGNIRILNLDLLTYAGNLENLDEVSSHTNYSFIKGDIADGSFILKLFEENKFDSVINFAAESHVDRSIADSSEFIRTNISGTHALLEAARKVGVQKFIQVSTDEVYGSLGPDGKFTETTPISPNSPYSASKASADLLVQAYYSTYGLPVCITRCSNNYGPFQFPEKLIPLVISNAIEDKAIPVYGDGLNVRDWIHVDDHNSAILKVLFEGIPGEVYNIGADSERSNIEIIRSILNILGKPETLITYVKDRPGHDRRYAIDSNKIRGKLNWIPQIPFQEGIRSTIEWYLENEEWIKSVKSGEYIEYYNKQYNL
jgi:dTDP-glucose 4,6-dehydratase